MKYPLVEVEWLDACSKHDEHTVHDLPLIPTVRTVGRLTKKTEEGVWVSGEILEDGMSETFRDTTVIPSGMVKRVRRL